MAQPHTHFWYLSIHLGIFRGKEWLDDSFTTEIPFFYLGSMSSLPHSRRSVSATRTVPVLLAILSLLAASCSIAESDDVALAESEPLIIETPEVTELGFEKPVPMQQDVSDPEGQDIDKIIVRRPAERFALNFKGMEAQGFGGVDFDVLEQAADTKIDYVVHPGALSIKAGRDGRSLRQRFDPSTDGSPRVEFAASIPDADDESWLSYRIYFERNFEWNKGGKLPGLAGGTNPTFEGADGTDGFSARLAWMPDGQMGVYLYHPDRPDELGELRGTFGVFKRQQWHSITQRVVMNSRGQSDGILEVWLDGHLVFTDNTMNWRTSGTFGADSFLYSAFYGGGSVDWAPTQTTYARIADISVSTTNQSLRTLSR